MAVAKAEATDYKPVSICVMEVNVDDVTVRPASGADKGDINRLMALAFVDDESTLAIVRGDRAKAARMVKMGTRMLIDPENRFSHVLVAERQGQVVGVSGATEWPHCQMTKGQMLRIAPAMIRAAGSALPRAFSVAKARAEHEPREAHWHCAPTAVDPQQRGHGIAKKLFQSVLDLADKEGAPVFTMPQSDRALEFAEGFGFKLIAEQEVLGISTRSMWREAR